MTSCIKKPFSGDRSTYFQFKQAYKTKVQKDSTVAYILGNRFIAIPEPQAAMQFLEEDEVNQDDAAFDGEMLSIRQTEFYSGMIKAYNEQQEKISQCGTILAWLRETLSPTELSEYADSILDDEDLDNREKVLEIMAVLDDEYNKFDLGVLSTLMAQMETLGYCLTWTDIQNLIQQMDWIRLQIESMPTAKRVDSQNLARILVERIPTSAEFIVLRRAIIEIMSDDDEETNSWDDIKKIVKKEISAVVKEIGRHNDASSNPMGVPSAFEPSDLLESKAMSAQHGRGRQGGESDRRDRDRSTSSDRMKDRGSRLDMRLRICYVERERGECQRENCRYVHDNPRSQTSTSTSGPRWRTDRQASNGDRRRGDRERSRDRYEGDRSASRSDMRRSRSRSEDRSRSEERSSSKSNPKPRAASPFYGRPEQQGDQRKQ